MLGVVKNARVGTRLAGVVLAFGVPLAVVLWFTVEGFNAGIRFATLELHGDAYLRPLVSMLSPLHEVGRAVRTGDAQAVQRAAGNVDRAMQHLDEVNAEAGEALQFTDEGLALRKREGVHPTRLAARWRGVRDGWRAMPPEKAEEATLALVADVRTAITHAGDTSNLILDPDLDSYYLMDVVLLALPQTLDRLGVIAARGRDLLAGDDSPAARMELAVLAAHLRESDMARIEGSLATALNEDAQFYGASASLRGAVDGALTRYRAETTGLLRIMDNLAGGGSADTAGFTRAVAASEAATLALWETSARELDVLLKVRIADYEARRTRALGLSLAAVLFALVLSWLTVRSVTRPLSQLVEYTRSVAQEGATAPLEGPYTAEFATLAASLASMVDGLAGLVARSEAAQRDAETQHERAVAAVADAVAARKAAAQATAEGMQQAASSISGVVERLGAAASQLAAQVEQVSGGAMQQRDALARVAGRVEEMSAGGEAVRSKAVTAAEGAGAASEQALEGGAAVERSMRAIAVVLDQTGRMRDGMDELGRRAGGIGAIMGVIGDIADQTNLLALNAAIEAARAGDAGRGFAVVADEVRKLAEKTMNATREVGDVVRAIQDGTRASVEQVERAVAAVEEASSHVRASEEVLQGIMGKTRVAADEVRDISGAVDAQAAASRLALDAVDEAERVSMETMTGMDEARSAVHELARHAQELRGVMETLRTA
ncbi:MAG TPA: methyl-accepting chemotaxis protein [Desulfovibrio sp.]|nr:methyl-accepting chemotaxis protein [Desulfovibrio sp.]